MIPQWLHSCKDFLEETISMLTGAQKRLTLTSMSKQCGKGDLTLVAGTFKVSRNTIRKGIRELESGVAPRDRFCDRGRLRAEAKLPDLLTDIQAVLDGQSQTDPSFKTEKLYTRLTVKAIRDQLIREKGYTDEELPTLQTINTKVNQRGYTLKKVKKAKLVQKGRTNGCHLREVKATP